MKLSSADHGYSCSISILRTYLRRLNSPSHRLTENCTMNKFLLALALKTLLFAVTVATLNSTVLIFGALLAVEILLLVIEFL